jgi:hypothetical protein
MSRGRIDRLTASGFGYGWASLSRSPAGDGRDRVAFRIGAPWEDLPVEFGPWQTAWKPRNLGLDLGRVLAQADTAEFIDWEVSADSTVEFIDWEVSADSTVNRARQDLSALSRRTGVPRISAALRVADALAVANGRLSSVG